MARYTLKILHFIFAVGIQLQLHHLCFSNSEIREKKAFTAVIISQYTDFVSFNLTIFISANSYQMLETRFSTNFFDIHMCLRTRPIE